MKLLLDREFGTLTRHANDSINANMRDLRTIMEVGDGWAQGDILVRRLSRVPTRMRPIEPRAQLAPGSTQGSRHCLSSLEGVAMFALAGFHPLLGPVFKAGRDVTITHLEHGHLLLGPGIYAIEYQRDLAEDLRRVAD